MQCGSAPAKHPNYFFDYFSGNLCFATPLVFCLILGLVEDVRSFYMKLFNMVRYAFCLSYSEAFILKQKHSYPFYTNGIIEKERWTGRPWRVSHRAAPAGRARAAAGVRRRSPPAAWWCLTAYKRKNSECSVLL